ncbi:MULTISPECIES: helix-turn-helix domain-containing protein [unclassified Pseudomonas]|uniref:helix-turn-helix domain-containing protein n=1 Tax=unclassified Pseudomonas TaxID=196821 RepID=UPI00384BADCF
MDALSEFFERIHMNGRLFYAGTVFDTLDINKPDGTAFIHIVENGGLDLIRPGHPRIELDGPTVLLCPSTCRYALQPTTEQGADIICATFEFGVSLSRSFPLGVTDTLVFPFRDIDPLVPVIQALLAEYRTRGAGHRKGLSVLFEYILIVLVRRAIEEGMIARGGLSAILDPQLGKAINAIHLNPDQEWTLKQLAELACMSRSKFSAQFLKVVGVSPIAYLTAWRMKLARDLMKQGVKLKIVAASVGYSSQAALSKAFTQEMGLPPGEWLKRQN